MEKLKPTSTMIKAENLELTGDAIKRTNCSMEDLKSTSEVRAKRLMSLRRLTRLSRREFTSRYGIPAGTLQNWEDARYGGLTDKGARRMISAFNHEGISVTKLWLLHGIGSSPQISDRLYLGKLSNSTAPPTQQPVTTSSQSFTTVVQELLLFRQLNHNTIDTIIADDGMEPRFVTNEQVAGIQRIGEEIMKIINMDCILQTAQGNILVRNLRLGSKDGYYNLACTNLNTSIFKPILYDVEIYAAAPIIWARRKDPMT